MHDHTLVEAIGPAWLKSGTQVTIKHDDSFVRGTLERDKQGDWCFHGEKKGLSVTLADIAVTYRQRLMEGSLVPAWPQNPGETDFSGIQGLIVPAADLECTSAPDGLGSRLDHLSPKDKAIWLASYAEEIDGLNGQHTYDVITEAEYQRYKQKGIKAIPTMAVFVVKPDEFGKPYRAKSRVVVLGNLEQHSWEADDL